MNLLDSLALANLVGTFVVVRVIATIWPYSEPMQKSAMTTTNR